MDFLMFEIVHRKTGEKIRFQADDFVRMTPEQFEKVVREKMPSASFPDDFELRTVLEDPNAN